jgi:hypothetical protein
MLSLSLLFLNQMAIKLLSLPFNPMEIAIRIPLLLPKVIILEDHNLYFHPPLLILIGPNLKQDLQLAESLHDTHMIGE